MADEAAGAVGDAVGDAALDGMTFEEIVAALEALTDRMAAGDIGIEEAAELYERAGRLHAAASARLAAVEERVERLRGAAGGSAGDG